MKNKVDSLEERMLASVNKSMADMKEVKQQSDGRWPYPTGTIEPVKKKKKKDTADWSLTGRAAREEDMPAIKRVKKAFGDDTSTGWPFPKSPPESNKKKK